ncbi:MAG: LPS assembly protein LptD [Parvularculaceae bacterium]
MSRRRRIAEFALTTALAGVSWAKASDDMFVVEARPDALPLDVIGDDSVVPEPAARPAYTVIASLDQAPGAGPLAVFDAPDRSSAQATEDDDVLFEADFVSREDETSPVVAEGNVRAYFGKRYLHADKLTYDIAADIVVAEGNVSITDTLGVTKETAFAGRVELTGDLRDGIAENFSALLAQNAKLAADTAVQEQGARTQLSKAVYTSCDVCTKKGKGKTPTWRVKALRVTRDRERRVVRFHHAFLEIKGVPILYAPFLQGPDPSVERQSGFLAPFFGTSSRLGFNVEIPYYLAISNHQDATFYPKYTSRDGVVWQGEYRRRDVSGAHVVQGSVLNFDETKPDENGNLPIDVPGVRWHFFARGHRDFGDAWTVGYDVERVSDDTYLRRYNIERRGDLRKEIDTSNTNRLRSNAFVRWQEGGSEFTADGFLFQGLRAQDIAAKTPYVLPLLNFRHDVQGDVFGGNAQVNANFAWLQRASGVDSQRLTVSGFWDREHITPGGHRLAAFAEVRADAYYFHDLQEGTEILPGDPTDRRDIDGRFAPSVGVEWSYPLTRRFAGARLLVEPRVQLIASPANRNASGIINEDSQSIEFDYAGLFEYNKSTGFDRFEDGQRMNVGVTASAEFDNGLEIEGAIGAQGRLQNSQAFDPSTGLGEKRSDFVGEVNVRYKDYIAVENRFRIDDEDGSFQRAESLATFQLWRFSGFASYVRLNEENIAAELVRREELTGTMRVKLTSHWATGFSWREDLEQDRTISQDFLIGYVDECASVDVIYKRDFTRDVGLGPDDSIFIRFTLKSLVE